MGLLKKATVEQAAAKVGIFAPQAAGKTTTALLLALGISKSYHGGAPIAFMDTENGSDYVVPIAEAEGVELRNFKSRAFKDMKTGLREAQESGCCAYIVDSYTHPWKELVDTFKAKSRRKKLEFHHMDELKSLWQGWTDLMLNSPLHVILAGRLGYVWDREEAGDDGEKGDLIKLGTKMKSESEAGYEPSLLIEMEAIQPDAARQKKTRAKQGSIVHHCYVMKDRWRVLNGRTFTFKDMNDYKVGGYLPVFNAFRPHFDRLAIGKIEQRAVDNTRTSETMFDGAGDTVHQQRARRVQIVLEEFNGTLRKVWPGETAKEKALRALTIETIFDTRSWAQVEDYSLERLELGLDAIARVEEAIEDGNADAATEAPALVALIGKSLQIETAARQQAEETVGVL